MTMTAPRIDPNSEKHQQTQNLIDTSLLIGGMTALTGLAAFLLLSWAGLAAAVLGVGALAMASPHMPPWVVMRAYRAAPMDRGNGRDFYAIVGELAFRAGMAKPPALHVIPSLTLNAFSVGTPDNAVIAVTEGLLRKLSLRQLAGVLAHELSHIRNNDLRILALADALSRAMQILSWVGLGLILFFVPQYFGGNSRVPLLAVALLYAAPALSTLLQLALARTREYDADLDAVHLTGDPEGLVSALEAVERYQGRMLEELIFPNRRRAPYPSLLRTHPATEVRVRRLRAIEAPDGQTSGSQTVGGQTPIALGADAPRISLVGVGPGAMRPRYRFPGLWF